jgi:hypothetical protein
MSRPLFWTTGITFNICMLGWKQQQDGQGISILFRWFPRKKSGTELPERGYFVGQHLRN